MTTWKSDPEDPAFELGWEGVVPTGERRRVSDPVGVAMLRSSVGDRHALRKLKPSGVRWMLALILAVFFWVLGGLPLAEDANGLVKYSVIFLRVLGVLVALLAIFNLWQIFFRMRRAKKADAGLLGDVRFDPRLGAGTDASGIPAVVDEKPSIGGLAPRRILPLWASAAIASGLTVVLLSGIVIGSNAIGQQRSSTLAHDECIRVATGLLKSPASASFSDTRVFGPVADMSESKSKEMNLWFVPLIAKGTEQVSASSITTFSLMSLEAGEAPDGYLVGGIVDSQNDYGAMVRNYFICATSVSGTEVTGPTSVEAF